jgi:single-strand DNA-binding protein
MKTITIAGNIGKDAETRRTQAGDMVTSWSVAVAGIGRDAPSTWFDVSMFGKRGETLAPVLRKGGYVIVSGDLTRRDHEGKVYLAVRADSVTLGPRREGSDDAHRAERSAPAKSAPASTVNDIDDEIPF